MKTQLSQQKEDKNKHKETETKLKTETETETEPVCTSNQHYYLLMYSSNEAKESKEDTFEVSDCRKEPKDKPTRSVCDL